MKGGCFASTTGNTHGSGPWWGRVTTMLLGIRPRVLGDQELAHARALLYEVYFTEQGWVPASPNPSGLVVDHAAEHFRDDLDVDAVWLGVFDRIGRLLGVTRFLERSALGRLEVERYVPLPKEVLAGGCLVEANRLAVRREARGSAAVLVLHLFAVSVARRRGLRRTVGTATPGGARSLVRGYGWRGTGLRFRYHPSDPEPVEVITFDLGPGIVGRALLGMARRGIDRALVSAPRESDPAQSRYGRRSVSGNN